MTKALSLVSLAVISVTLGAQTPTSPETRDRSALATPQTPSQSQSATDAPAQRARAAQVDATSVNAELTKGLDAKHVHVGDEVDARTTSEAKLADGTTLPRGTKLVGKIVDVKAKSKEEKNSRMVISLNRAVLKDGRQVAIQSALTSMTAPAQSANESNYAAVSVPSGGGNTGGASGTSGSGGSTPVPRSIPSSDAGQSQQGQVLKGAGDRVTVGNKPNIMLSAPTTPDSAGVLEAQGENVSLESGTKLTLNVIPAQG